jgi:predicted metallo-beta-lactamase superfamily hydrolase
LLDKIKIIPLAAESLGARSMCTLVKTPDANLLFDPGVSLAPYRFGLLPHPFEFRNIRQLRTTIAEAAEKADVLTVSHYHFDHHTPSFEDWLVNWTAARETANQIFQGKTILLKNPKENINASQRHRAWVFQKTGGREAKKLAVADGKTFHFGNTTIRFSPAVPHGSEDGFLGWVVMGIVEYDGEKFMHASDVQGPMSENTAKLILSERPDLLIISGPPFYLSGFKVKTSQLQRGLQNLAKIVENISSTILEHHILRDEDWFEKTAALRTLAQNSGHNLLTAAEYSSKENNFLEYKRRRLYLENPPSEEFDRWTRLGSAELSHSKPPI